MKIEPLNQDKQKYLDIVKIIARESVKESFEKAEKIQKQIKQVELDQKPVRRRATLLVNLLSYYFSELYPKKSFETDNFVFSFRKQPMVYSKHIPITSRKISGNTVKKLVIKDKRGITFQKSGKSNVYRIICNNADCITLSLQLEQDFDLFAKVEQDISKFFSGFKDENHR